MARNWEQVWQRRPRNRRLLTAICSVLAVLAVFAAQSSTATAASGRARTVGVDPGHRLSVPVQLSELPVPPTAPSDTAGSCTTAINPHGTGCVSGSWGALGSPGFFWDAHYVLLGVTFSGAPTSGPSSVYTGQQVLLVRTDRKKFPNGDPWKCLTCGVSPDSEQGIVTSDFTYPPAHALPGDHQVLVGNGILQCGTGTLTYDVTDSRCNPANTQILPIYWGNSPLGSGDSGPERPRVAAQPRRCPPRMESAGNQPELLQRVRLRRPTDIEHGQNPVRPDQRFVRYPTPRHMWHRETRCPSEPRQMIGELRGWTSDGKSILGIQSSESDSIDAWATSLATGKAEQLTRPRRVHRPDVHVPERQMAARGASPRLGSTGLHLWHGGSPGGHRPAAHDRVRLRNSQQLEPALLPALVGLSGQRRTRSEQVNAFGDPNWNAAADPVWLADSTAVVWAENLACGANPSRTSAAIRPSPVDRNSRVMIARFSLKPSKATPPKPISDTVPWGIPYTPGQAFPASTPSLPAGTYSLHGKVRGTATVVVTANATQDTSIGVTYANFTDRPGYTINGTESVQLSGSSPFTATVTWQEDLALSGLHNGTKVTSPDGFTLGASVLLQNNFQATGTMTTTIDGQTYTQPANGT